MRPLTSFPSADIDQTLSAIDAVTIDEVHAVAQDVLGAAATLAVIGPAKALASFS